MGARFHMKSESRKSRKSRKSPARYFGRISQSREIQKVRDFRNPSRIKPWVGSGIPEFSNVWFGYVGH